jgi:hypothetical protein
MYMGHCRFLLEKHPLRKKGMHWKGKVDHHTKPSHFEGEEIFEMIKDLLRKTKCISYVCQDHNFTHMIDSWV